MDPNNRVIKRLWCTPNDIARGASPSKTIKIKVVPFVKNFRSDYVNDNFKSRNGASESEVLDLLTVVLSDKLY